VVNKSTRSKHEKGWYRVLILVIIWLLIISLTRDVWQIRTGFSRIAEANRRLEIEKKKNEDLKEKLGMVMTDDYKEKIIREKLNMQKEGEVLVVMPDKAFAQEEVRLVKFVPNWRKWWNLLSM